MPVILKHNNEKDEMDKSVPATTRNISVFSLKNKTKLVSVTYKKGTWKWMEKHQMIPKR